jgi:hypothetical protein
MYILAFHGLMRIYSLPKTAHQFRFSDFFIIKFSKLYGIKQTCKKQKKQGAATSTVRKVVLA